MQFPLVNCIFVWDSNPVFKSNPIVFTSFEQAIPQFPQLFAFPVNF
jgi:hypothetical protein